MKLRIEMEGCTYDVSVEFVPDRPPSRNGHGPLVEVPAAVIQTRPPQKLPEDRFCRCPITGRVMSVAAAPGQKVRKNETVVIVEAMKMEINVGPAVDGVVETVHVSPGDMVKTGQVLFELA
jgi:biotin carboxyl carrier protein